jgi:nucleoside-diphosphate-sugar epimerase
MSTLCLLGASGFVGACALARAPGRVRALVHTRPLQVQSALEVVEGDAADARALDRLLERDAVVLNFAYGGEARGVQLAEALGNACARRGVRRLVHVSTCSVYGSSPGELIDEDSPCAPIAAYERAKLAIEGVLERGMCELAILRPTAVFGPRGRNLESLALRVLRESWPRRWLRAAAMGRRRMNAVDVECVAEAALFLATAPLEQSAERFIVSQDEVPENNYADIEAFFARRFSVKPSPRHALPPAILRLGLKLSGRSNTDPHRRYSAARLARRGFRAPRSFAAALNEYATWIEAQHARS